MNSLFTQSDEEILAPVTTETSTEIRELQVVELAYVGGGMANVSFV